MRNNVTDKTRWAIEHIPFLPSVPYEDRKYYLERKNFDSPKPRFEPPDKIPCPFIGVDL